MILIIPFLNNKCYDPLLKLYHGRPLCINQNDNVANGIANGTMCKFVGVVLQPGVTETELESIVVDGYYVRCADITQLHSLQVELVDG